jgi:hypothetical protein
VLFFKQIPTPPGEKNLLEQLREEKDHDPSFVEVLNYLTKVSEKLDNNKHFSN